MLTILRVYATEVENYATIRITCGKGSMKLTLVLIRETQEQTPNVAALRRHQVMSRKCSLIYAASIDRRNLTKRHYKASTEKL